MSAKHTPGALTIEEQAALYRAIRGYYIANGEHATGRYAHPQSNGGVMSVAAATPFEYDSAMLAHFGEDIAKATGGAA